MNWTDLAPTVGAIAPTLGRLLGQTLPLPFGGDLGSAAGSAIAAALGVDATPQAVGTALGATHNDVLVEQLKAAEGEAKAKYAALAAAFQAEGTVAAAQETAVAATQQAELVNGAWYQRWWRPMAMYVWIFSWPVQLGAILMHQSGDSAAIVTALSVWNAGPAALAGVYSWNRSQEKIAGVQ